jgi:zinc protease
MLRFRIAIVAALCLLAAVPGAAISQQLPGEASVRSTTLANGMKVIVWPDHDIPNVALYNWVHVGSRNEALGTTGLAHFFEHMMFNGTARRAQGEFDKLMEAQGGANNAFTSDDVTVYQDWFPRSALELVFDLESDRLANLAFVPSVVESERNVVYSERRLRVEDSNQGTLFEQVQSTAFVAHPYQIPTIGWPSDIKAWKIEDLQKFFRTNYAPNNCTLVLVGDVEPEEVFALARKYFEKIPRQESPPPLRTIEPEQQGEKRVMVERKGQTPLLYAAYKAPPPTDPRSPALNLLLTVLADGDSSRLHRLLVEDRKLAISVDTFLQEGFDPGLMWLLLALPEGGEVSATQKVLDEELARVARQGVTEAELRRAKNLTEADFWKSVATINGKAKLLGEYDVIRGDWHGAFAAPLKYEQVTLEQIKAVAAEVLQQRHRTIGVLVPKSRDGEG